MHDNNMNFLIIYLDKKQQLGEIINYSVSPEPNWAGYEVRLMFSGTYGILIHRSYFSYYHFQKNKKWILDSYEQCVFPKINSKLYKLFYRTYASV